jgi:hypothetical protein
MGLREGNLSGFGKAKEKALALIFVERGKRLCPYTSIAVKIAVKCRKSFRED